MTKEGAAEAVSGALERLAVVEDWSVAAIEGVLREMLATLELSARKGLQPLRVAVSGSSVSPPLFESIAVLGRERTLERLRSARDLMA